jgi:hypothetical protein
MSDETFEDITAEAGKAPYYTILEVWRAVLHPAAGEKLSRITPQWANRIVNTFQGIKLSDMPRFRDKYFELILELGLALDEEIDGDDECLKHTSAEEDVEHNTGHYLNVLFTWQRIILQRELDWECTSHDAAIELAVLSEVHKMFFSENGLTALLDQINFEFTDSDRQLLASELADMQNTQEGR